MAKRPTATRHWVWFGRVLVGIAAFLAVMPITANSGIFGEPRGDTGTVWCGNLFWRTDDCPGCCEHADVLSQRLGIVLIVLAVGLAVLLAERGHRRRLERNALHLSPTGAAAGDPE